VERFDLDKLCELDVRQQYQIKVSNTFAALQNSSDTQDINRAWENIKKNIKISAKDSLGLYKYKQHKLWFYEECAQLLD
jgi:hypothetical protein